jgi:hypothetical protein
MNQAIEPSDECHCRFPLEILSVKIGLRGTAMNGADREPETAACLGVF